MKKFLLGTLFIISAFSAQAKDIQLVKPDTNGGMPLFEAIKARRSGRAFDDKMLSDKHLSELLWATWGLSSDDGKRVVPTARNKQDIELYVLLQSGAYIYDAEKNLLKQTSDEDLRHFLGQEQKFALTAPVHLLFVTDNRKYGDMHAGSMYQNAGLYCAMENLTCVVRGLYDHEGLDKALGLIGDQKTVITFAAGYPKP